MTRKANFQLFGFRKIFFLKIKFSKFFLKFLIFFKIFNFFEFEQGKHALMCLINANALKVYKPTNLNENIFVLGVKN